MHYSTQAVALDPLHPILTAGHIINCQYANLFDLAKAAIETGRALFDQSFAFHIAIANYWMMKADYGQAVAAFQKAYRLNPNDKGILAICTYCEAKGGNRRKAITFLHELRATTGRSDYERAVVYAGLEQADSSLYYLKKAADKDYYYRDTKVMPASPMATVVRPPPRLLLVVALP